MKRVALPFALLVAASAHAQSAGSETGLRIHVGYGFTPSFKTFGDHESMNGPEIGIALPIAAAFGQGIWLEPSYFGGGRFAHGGDTDADVYRIMVFARHALRRGVGVRVGVGYSGTGHPRGGNFDGQSDVVFDLGVDVPFRIGVLKKIQPYVDVHNVFSPKNALAGFFVGVGVKV